MPRRAVPIVLAAALAAASAGPALAQGAQPQGRAEAFVTGIRDLPLMPGLTQVGGEDVQFDKPEGRIVEAAAEGRVEPARVRAFYRETLPQLGWAPRGEGEFVREGEALRLEFAQGAGPAGRAATVVRFVLRPAAD